MQLFLVRININGQDTFRLAYGTNKEEVKQKAVDYFNELEVAVFIEVLDSIQ